MVMWVKLTETFGVTKEALKFFSNPPFEWYKLLLLLLLCSCCVKGDGSQIADWASHVQMKKNANDMTMRRLLFRMFDDWTQFKWMDFLSGERLRKESSCGQQREAVIFVSISNIPLTPERNKKKSCSFREGTLTWGQGVARREMRFERRQTNKCYAGWKESSQRQEQQEERGGDIETSSSSRSTSSSANSDQTRKLPSSFTLSLKISPLFLQIRIDTHTHNSFLHVTCARSQGKRERNRSALWPVMCTGFTSRSTLRVRWHATDAAKSRKSAACEIIMAHEYSLSLGFFVHQTAGKMEKMNTRETEGSKWGWNRRGKESIESVSRKHTLHETLCEVDGESCRLTGRKLLPDFCWIVVTASSLDGAVHTKGKGESDHLCWIQKESEKSIVAFDVWSNEWWPSRSLFASVPCSGLFVWSRMSVRVSRQHKRAHWFTIHCFYYTSYSKRGEWVETHSRKLKARADVRTWYAARDSR